MLCRVRSTPALAGRLLLLPILVTSLLALTSSIGAGTPSWVAHHSATARSHDTADDVAVHLDGAVSVAARSGDATYLEHYDASGTRLWSHVLESSRTCPRPSIVVPAGDEVVLVREAGDHRTTIERYIGPDGTLDGSIACGNDCVLTAVGDGTRGFFAGGYGYGHDPQGYDGQSAMVSRLHSTRLETPVWSVHFRHSNGGSFVHVMARDGAGGVVAGGEWYEPDTYQRAFFAAAASSAGDVLWDVDLGVGPVEAIASVPGGGAAIAVSSADATEVRMILPGEASVSWSASLPSLGERARIAHVPAADAVAVADHVASPVSTLCDIRLTLLAAADGRIVFERTIEPSPGVELEIVDLEGDDLGVRLVVAGPHLTRTLFIDDEGEVVGERRFDGLEATAVSSTVDGLVASGRVRGDSGTDLMTVAFAPRAVRVLGTFDRQVDSQYSYPILLDVAPDGSVVAGFESWFGCSDGSGRELVRYDAAGAVLWTRRFGEVAFAAVTADENGAPWIAFSRDRRLEVVGFDLDGNEVFRRRLPLHADERPEALQVRGDRGLVGLAHPDGMALVAFDRRGVKLWRRTYTEFSRIESWTMRLADDGRAYFFDWNRSPRQFVLDVFGDVLVDRDYSSLPHFQPFDFELGDGGEVFMTGDDRNGWVTVRLDGESNLAWVAREPAGEHGGQGYYLSRMPDGGVVVHGTSRPELRERDAMLVRYDAQGTKMWQKLRPSDQQPLPRPMSVDRLGRIYTVSTYQRERVAHVAVYWPTGDLIWEERYSPDASVDATRIGLDFNFGITVGGSVTGGPAYVLRYPAVPHSPGGHALQSTAPRLRGVVGPAPNPSLGSVRVGFALEQATAVSWLVLDVAGRRVAGGHTAELAPGEHVLTWDGRTAAGRPAARGVYFYRIDFGDRVITRKLVRGMGR